jgi:hypothetical protein
MKCLPRVHGRYKQFYGSSAIRNSRGPGGELERLELDREIGGGNRWEAQIELHAPASKLLNAK